MRFSQICNSLQETAQQNDSSFTLLLRNYTYSYINWTDTIFHDEKITMNVKFNEDIIYQEKKSSKTITVRSKTLSWKSLISLSIPNIVYLSFTHSILLNANISKRKHFACNNKYVVVHCMNRYGGERCLVINKYDGVVVENVEPSCKFKYFCIFNENRSFSQCFVMNFCWIRLLRNSRPK